MDTDGLLKAVLGKRRSPKEFAADMHALARNRRKMLLGIACVVAVVVFWGAGRWFGIPRYARFDDSLALQPKPAAVLLLTGFLLWLCVAVCTAVTARVRFDAGLFSACVGLAALSVRGGPVRYVFQNAIDNGTGRAVFLAMTIELAALFGFLAIAWLGLWTLHRRGHLEGDALRDGLADQQHTLGKRATAAFTQMATMALLMLLLARVDDKKQVLSAVFLSSLLGTLLAYSFAPVRPAVWFWVAPLFVGLVGYVAGYMTWGHGGWSLWKAGLGSGFLAPLARPLPLDYASVGPAGAILGYWVSRGWERAKQLETAASTSGPNDNGEPARPRAEPA